MDDVQLEEDTLIIFNDESRVASPPLVPSEPNTTPIPEFNLDIQGIPWNLSRIPREEYRLQRMREYAALELRRELQIYVGDDLRACIPSKKPLYEFNHINRSFPCTAQHFQLRHLVWAPTTSSVYYTYGRSLMEWDPISNMDKDLFNFHSVAGAHSRISTICATSEVILVGGFYGELILFKTPLNSRHPHADPILRRITNEENGITNHITPFSTDRGKFLISSNDCLLRVFDSESSTIIPLKHTDVAINATSMSPDGNLISMAKDSNTVELMDLRTKEIIRILTGHTAYSFSCDWSPDGRFLATGNEDHTARIYDIRGSSNESLYVLGARMAPIRNVKFSPDGTTLSIMEECDFVVLYDASDGLFNKTTTIDFFGEVSGVSFSPDSRFFYIGCGEAERGGLLEFERPSQGMYILENFLLL